jgi:hypothetical protein
MQDPASVEQIAMKYLSLAPMMDERMRRQWAASEARAYGWGVRAVSGAIGMSPNTIRRGLAELQDRQAHPDVPVDLRVRRRGGGRKALSENDPDLLNALEHLVDPVTRGELESPLRWTCKSTTQLAAALTGQAGYSGGARPGWRAACQGRSGR